MARKSISEVLIARQLVTAFLLTGVLLAPSNAADQEAAEQRRKDQNEIPVDFDFAYRDSLPQTDTPRHKWNTKWGPKAKVYPPFILPDAVKDPTEYRQRRVVAVAMKYIDLPYKHKHIPAAGGLDCSNFTSWVYNYAFGVKFSSGIGTQAETAGRKLLPIEEFQPGDLLFQKSKSGTSISHVVIYIGENKIIDSTNGKVAVRDLKGWYVTRHSHARRLIR
ncbi:NlpC/P60 family protein [uncultured Rubinisphaera sp.]|uniref:C40 family peptidase n=1 Tax=uncultured Rubinisphaera sp. TaxID=1678686 RepID=UPI0030D748F7|tara:strand:- start:2293 stop:2952 length:660 start_codon:yes stop_codon:yes gene_type:complete